MPRLGSSRLIAAVVALAFAAAAPFANAAPPTAQMPEQHRAFFKSYCVECHGAKKQKGKMRLDDLGFDLAANVQTAEAWQKILAALNSGDMPPEDEKQPTSQEKTAFLEELSNKMVVARKMLSDNGGAVVMRRLNRREYQNTIRDLLGVGIEVNALPNDAVGGSFDTVGASLFFSADQLERYLELGRKALGEVIATGAAPRPKLRTEHRETEIDANKKVGDRLTLILHNYRVAMEWKTSGKPFKEYAASKSSKEVALQNENGAKFYLSHGELYMPTYAQYLLRPYADIGAFLTLSEVQTRYHLEVTIKIPADAPPGDYLLRLKAGTLAGTPSHRCFVQMGHRGKDEKFEDEAFDLLGCYQVTGKVPAGEVLEIPVAIGKEGSRSFTFREKRHLASAAARTLYDDARAANGIGYDPVVWIDWVEWEGPVVKEWPPQAYQQLFFKGPSEPPSDDYAREIIQRFATRAFRGKEPGADFLDGVAGIYQQHLKAGATFANAVQEALAVVLASPDFLYLSEPATDAKPRELTDLELATRLAYFLWSAPPDDALLAAARDGSLRKPEVLRAQVDRLLDNAKSWEFVTGFTHQWLGLDRLDFFQFNHKLYPEFDESTKTAARDEVFHFFNTVLRENLSARSFLESDFVVINGLLASYYGIAGVKGDAWRKVKLSAPSERGGLLGMAGILAMGSNGERTSPVERGVFVLRRLLNDPPPPAPANVPQLSRLENKILTTRERLLAHQEQAQCAHCHRKIDPIGFGLENFDAAGRWRTEETYMKKGVGAKTWAIAAAGALHNGPAFKDYFELRSVCATRTDAFSRGLIESLLGYALGRSMGFSDEEFIAQLQDGMKRDQHRVRSLIHAITQSRSFQSK